MVGGNLSFAYIACLLNFKMSQHSCHCKHDAAIGFGRPLVSSHIRVEFFDDEDAMGRRDDEVSADKSKVELCPSEIQFIGFRNKRINRVNILKYQKYIVNLSLYHTFL